MIKAALVGCTGKLGRAIAASILAREDICLAYAIAREGNPYVGKSAAEVFGAACPIDITDDILAAKDADVFIDCTNAAAFTGTNFAKYKAMKKPLVIGTTGLKAEDTAALEAASAEMPIFISSNFSVALHDFIELLQLAVKKVDDDIDVTIIEHHHRFKKDAPSGTALMIKRALLKANPALTDESINVLSVRGGSVFGIHEVIFASTKDEVVSYKHEASSRRPFAEGAIKAALWTVKQGNGFYNMDDLCK